MNPKEFMKRRAFSQTAPITGGEAKRKVL